MSTTRALLPRPATFHASHAGSDVEKLLSRTSHPHHCEVPSASLWEGRRRNRTSGIEEEEEEEEEDVRSRRRRSCQPEMSDHGCIHLNNFKAAKGIQPYKVIHSYFVASTSTEARIRKVCLSFSCMRFMVKILCVPFCFPPYLPFLLTSLSPSLSLPPSLSLFRGAFSMVHLISYLFNTYCA